ncbi:hypothetical protein C7C56_020825 [Massilia glaciei]|uniref:Uncharacterized protein n=1 Tax=Massilia glaciei TaxID=1524097 RepID=A0A2U2HFZ3_9BURK|nr:hypothetical protein C7C56_020825 [Massilia glaciei]
MAGACPGTAMVGAPAFAHEATVFTLRTAESDTDTRFRYDNEVLVLALEKTVKKYGPYTLRCARR